MKILFAIKSLDGAVGGAERMLCQIAGEMARRGHAVSVLTYDRPGGRTFFSLPAEVRRLSLGIGRPSAPTTLGETLQRMIALRRVVRAEQPDIAVAFMCSMFVPFSVALAGTGLPVIASERSSAHMYRGRLARRALLHLVPLFASRITTLGDRITEGFPPRLRPAMVAIPNPVDARRARADTAGNGRKTLLSVGSLSPTKDHQTLIGAFAAVAREFPDWDLRIVGEGALRPLLERQVRQHSLDRRVSLPGATEHIEVEYLSAQLYVVPSLHEGFGCAIAEALAHGLPAIGFAHCPGANVLIKDGANGLLAAGGNRVHALIRSLRTLMSDANLRATLGQAAPDTLAAFDPALIYDRWEGLLLRYAKTESFGH